MRYRVRWVALTLVCAACAGAARGELPPAPSATFQYAVPVTTDKPPGSQAFLWLPAAAPRVRGVLMAGMTLAEREMVKDARVRRACAERGIAIVFLKCGLA